MSYQLHKDLTERWIQKDNMIGILSIIRDKIIQGFLGIDWLKPIDQEYMERGILFGNSSCWLKLQK